MSEFKGTKGKWEVGDGIPNGIDNLKGNIQILSSCDFSWDIACVFKDVYFSNKDNIAEANAKLIASAPEMLEMLKNVFSYFEDNQEKVGTPEIMYQIENLIKKATE